MRSLGDLIRDKIQQQHLGENQGHHHTHPQKQAENPSEQEMRDYLASLAKAYRLPEDVVQATAMTESTFNPHKVHHNPAYKEKNRKLIPPNEDYGLIQINSSKIGREWVKDRRGRSSGSKGM